MCWTEPAVAARTAVQTAARVRVGVGDRATATALGHAVDADGDLIVAVSERRLEALFRFTTRRPGDPVTGTAVAEDIAPVPLAERIRRTVTVRGPLAMLTGAARSAARRLVRAREPGSDPLVWDADAGLLRLEPTSVTTAARCLCVEPAEPVVRQEVAVADYLAARPDPLAEVEADWLCHLALDHKTTLLRLAKATAPWLDATAAEVSPLGVDRGGLRLRARWPGGSRDLHLAFDEPVACPCEANQAINDLFVRA